MMLVMAGSLALNVIAAVLPAVADRLGRVVEGVTGLPSVASQSALRADALHHRLVAAEAEAAADRVLLDELRKARDAAATLMTEVARQTATAREATTAAARATAAARQATEAARAASSITYRGSRATPAEAAVDTAERFAALALASSSASVASSYAEALPIIGVGVIAADTAAQVDANCQMTAALNELAGALNPGRAPSAGARAVCAIEAPDRDALWQATTGDAAALWADARALYPGLPDLEIGPQWQSSAGMWQAVHDWAYGSPAGPPDAAGRGPAGPPAAIAPSDWRN